ncbi:MAG: 3'(2'),5'-bisphosphate nucleotidase CysQ [Nitrospirae bacterium]|nr:3'(2'),5'-bisphosphate nucleotidase CysQ [Nitrospirota bacterium]
MEIYGRKEIEVTLKDDRTPLTAADRASHDLIRSTLETAFPEIPCISEEGREVPYEERKEWRRFWLVDPLDGTREFIQRTGDFTVNIALIEEGRPVWGVVYAPATEALYYASKEEGAWKQAGEETPVRIRVNAHPGEKGVVAVASRAHASEGDDRLLTRLAVRERISVGSSLKFCVVAEGKADVYPRLNPTYEWDTAAGQCVLEAAGGVVLDPSGGPLRYNKPTLKNDGFIAHSGQIDLG